MREIPHSEKNQPGTWRRITVDGTPAAQITCPDCGKRASMTDHHVSDDGVVTPSAVCPHGCGFHEWIQLQDWEPSP